MPTGQPDGLGPTRPSPLGLFIQPACLQHRYIRHANSSHIFERPERLRAVLLGVAAGVARLELAGPSSSSSPPPAASDDLASLLGSLSLGPPPLLALVAPPAQSAPGQVLLHHPALHLAHAPPPEMPLPLGIAPPAGSPYLRDLFKWASEAVEMIRTTGSEIPQGLGLNQGDLYLGPGSIVAIEGAVQTVCQAVDRVCATATPTLPSTPPHEKSPPLEQPFSKAFCAIRPPGHHCGEDEPSGFCYVNNVVVGAMHAYLQHDIDRAIIIDFDLHHGNGTQALVMPINAASHAEDLAVAAGKPPSRLRGRNDRLRRGWKGFYGSVHDIYSYPCEDGDVDLIKDASVSLAAHGQYIENIHLQPYTSEDDFYARIYPKYLALLDKARVFMQETGADPDRTVVFISAGFDACEHEHQAMQRHDRRVPTSFFSRYTRDIVAFADAHASGRVVSVLEGGYSDRALMSAAMGHAIGLLDRQGEAGWWAEPELVNIEKAAKRKRTGKLNPPAPDLPPHLARAHALLSLFESTGAPADTAAGAAGGVASAATTPRERMTLRDRRRADDDAPGSTSETTPPAAARRRRPAASAPTTPARRGAGAREAPAAALDGAPAPPPLPAPPAVPAVPASASVPDIQVSASSPLKPDPATPPAGPALPTAATARARSPARAKSPARSPRKSLPRAAPTKQEPAPDVPPVPAVPAVSPMPPVPVMPPVPAMPPASSYKPTLPTSAVPASSAPALPGRDTADDLDGAIAALALVSLGSASGAGAREAASLDRPAAAANPASVPPIATAAPVAPAAPPPKIILRIPRLTPSPSPPPPPSALPADTDAAARPAPAALAALAAPAAPPAPAAPAAPPIVPPPHPSAPPATHATYAPVYPRLPAGAESESESSASYVSAPSTFTREGSAASAASAASAGSGGGGGGGYGIGGSGAANADAAATWQRRPVE